MAGHVEKFNNKSWKSYSQQTTINKEGYSSPEVQSAPNSEKEPLLETPKDGKGRNYWRNKGYSFCNNVDCFRLFN